MKKIEFFSVIPGVVETNPVYEASKYSAKWMSRVRDDYLAVAKQNPRFDHLYKCPGIFDMFKHGYIIPAWHDVVIKTDGEDGFQAQLPSRDFQAVIGDMMPVSKHGDNITKYIPYKPNALKTIVKFNTPWNVVAPKGVKFLMLPIPYPDTFEFEATTGVLDPGISSEINVQVFWNIKNGTHTVKAGTPLAFLVPLSEQTFKLVCRDATEWDRLWLKKKDFASNFTFSLKRNIIKDIYHKHFGDKDA